MISDTRHHHKRPLYFNISKFNGSKEQLKISRLSKACSKIVEDYVNHNEKVKEAELKGLIQEKLNQIEDIGLKMLRSKETLGIVKEYFFK